MDNLYLKIGILKALLICSWVFFIAAISMLHIGNTSTRLLVKYDCANVESDFNMPIEVKNKCQDMIERQNKNANK
jgi:hypothetical protein